MLVYTNFFYTFAIMNLSKRQVDIITASKDLIGEKGVRNLTIKNIAAKMCFSEPALYRHFKGKNEIIKALLIFHKHKIQTNVASILKSEKSAINKFKSILEFKFEHIGKNPELVMIVFSETSFQYNSILSEVVNKMIKQRTNKIMQIIKDGQKEGSIREDVDPQQLAIILLGGIRNTILAWKLSGFSSNLQADGKKLWVTFEKIFKK